MKRYKKQAAIILAAVCLGVIAEINERLTAENAAGNQLQRNAPGEGSYEEEMQLTVDGLLTSYDYVVDVPEQKLTKAEEMEYVKAAEKEIEAEFPGKNRDLSEIRKQVIIRDSYQNGLVKAEWSFDRYEIMDFEGNVIAQDIAEEGEVVCASVDLTCENAYVQKQFCFRVYPPMLSEAEQILAKINERISKQETKSEEKYLLLPDKINGYQIFWKKKREHMAVKILLLGIVLAGMVPVVEQSRAREQQKNRAKKLLLEYPEMVSKLAILLSAGMTVQGAWRKIAAVYEKQSKNGEKNRQEVYEEMLITCHELESGMGEERAYERFGERCAQGCYRRLGNLLAQNLRKGSRGIVTMLEKEAYQAQEERKQHARKYGEEAGTKLLFPMMMMLCMVLLLLIFPAVMAIQI